MERRIFPEGADDRKRSYEQFRWSRFKNLEAREMYTPVDMLDHVPMEDRDPKGDIYEDMRGKIATAGQYGQFRSPRHIIRLMVALLAPKPTDVICDPACGTCGFLVTAGEYLREQYPEIFRDAALREHLHHGPFHGFDFDNVMLRIGSMNMVLHGMNPGYPLSRFAFAGPCRRGREIQRLSRESALRRVARLRAVRQGSASDRQGQEDRASFSRPILAAVETWRARGGDRA